MAAGSFLAGGLGGYTSQASKMKKAGQAGLLRRKKPKTAPAPVKQIKLPEGASLSMPRTFRHGGRVKKGGMGKMHRGEMRLTRKQAKRMKKR